eukprot:g4131.t1
MSDSEDESGPPTVVEVRARIADRERELTNLTRLPGEGAEDMRKRQASLKRLLSADKEERDVLEASALLRKTAALAAFSHLETKTAFESGSASAAGEESAGLRGPDLMKAYRRLGELQSVARRYPDLESTDIKVENFFSDDNDEDDEDAMTCGLFNGDEWSVDVTFDKATGRVTTVNFEEDDGSGEGDMVKNDRVGSLLQRVLEQDDWAAFAEEIDLLMHRKNNSHHEALENAVRVVTSVSERSGHAVRERSTTSDATYFRGRRCIGYTKLMSLQIVCERLC